MRVYGHVIEELEDAPRISAEDAIRAARAKHVSVLNLAGTGTDGPVSEGPVSSERPEQDSNLRPTP